MLSGVIDPTGSTGTDFGSTARIAFRTFGGLASAELAGPFGLGVDFGSDE